MKKMNTTTLGVALGAGILASVALLPQARGQLVYETDLQAATQTEGVAERELNRQALGAVVRVESIPTEQVVNVSQTAINSAASPALEEIPNFTKTELMRRARTRVELKNEDMLQERLEELRLRDEKRRTQELFSGSTELALAPATPPTQAVAVLKEEPVGTLATQPEPTPVVVAAVTTGSSVATLDSDTDVAMVFVQPRAGVANMASQSYYDMRPRYSIGLDLGVMVSPNLSFEAGYTFSEYGVALNNGYQTSMITGGYLGNFETVAMKQNVGDLGLKLHFLGPDARLRPFIGGGGAYAKSFINYDQAILDRWDAQSRQYYGRDYSLTQFLGFLGTGFDIRVNKSIFVGATFKYYTVLSARENATINNNAMYGAMYGTAPYYGYQNPYATSGYDVEKQMVGGSVAKASFYTIAVGTTFIF